MHRDLDVESSLQGPASGPRPRQIHRVNTRWLDDKDTMMDKKTYDRLMEQGATGTTLAADTFDALAAFAKAKRLRRPDAAWRLGAPAKAATPARRGMNKGKTCSVKDCGKDAYCKGKCSAHYARDRRLDPAERERAREASRRSYAKRKATSVEVAK